MPTVDPADIRGLVTTLLVPSDACLTLCTRIGRSRLLTPSRVTPNRGRAPTRGLELSLLSHALIGTSFAIAHMKAMSSRATAVTAMFECLPRELSLRNRLHKRSWAFQPMS